MSVKMRQEVERRIAEQVIKDAIAAGYTLGVYDGEEVTLRGSSDAAAVLGAMFTSDEDSILVYDSPAPTEDAPFGWVRFIYGNDGWDVIHDYTINLEPVMVEANKLADSYS